MKQRKTFGDENIDFCKNVECKPLLHCKYFVNYRTLSLQL